jgi:chromosome partitioning protein
VSQSSDDVAARGRAIFRRLRAQDPAQDTGDPLVPEEVAVEPEPLEERAAPVVVASDSTPEHEPASDSPTPAAPAVEPEAQIIVIPDEPGEAEATEPDAEEPLTAPPGPAPSPLPGLVGLPEIPEPIHDEPLAAPEAAPEPVAAEAETPEPPASPFARPLPRVIAIANQKGGVGKTTTAVNLGACLADLGYRVLVVDLDPQGNASTGMGVNIRDLQGSMYDVILHELPIEDCVEATSVRNLFCAPSSLELAGADVELVPAFSRELRLKRALDEVKEDYDFVLIDCPPSLGLLTVNAFAAASEVAVPIQCEYYALEGLGQLLRNVNLVQKNLNPALELSALILVMYDARTKLADQVVSEVREHFGEKVCKQVVPRTVRLSEAPSFGQPIIAFDPSSRGAIAYRELAKEVSGGTPQRTG